MPNFIKIDDSHFVMFTCGYIGSLTRPATVSTRSLEVARYESSRNTRIPGKRVASDISGKYRARSRVHFSPRSASNYLAERL